MRRTLSCQPARASACLSRGSVLVVVRTGHGKAAVIDLEQDACDSDIDLVGMSQAATVLEVECDSLHQSVQSIWICSST